MFIINEIAKELKKLSQSTSTHLMVVVNAPISDYEIELVWDDGWKLFASERDEFINENWTYKHTFCVCIDMYRGDVNYNRIKNILKGADIALGWDIQSPKAFISQSTDFLTSLDR